MPPKTTSFVLSEDILTRLAERIYPGISKSETLRQDIETYWSVLDISMNQVQRKITRNQAMLILDIQNGTWMGAKQEAGMWLGSGLIAQVEDGCSLDGLHEKWQVDKDHLLQALHGLHPIQRFALVDWCRWMWGSHTRLSLDKNHTEAPSELWERELAKFPEVREVRDGDW